VSGKTGRGSFQPFEGKRCKAPKLFPLFCFLVVRFCFRKTFSLAFHLAAIVTICMSREQLVLAGETKVNNLMKIQNI